MVFVCPVRCVCNLTQEDCKQSLSVSTTSRCISLQSVHALPFSPAVSANRNAVFLQHFPCKIDKPFINFPDPFVYFVNFHFIQRPNSTDYPPTHIFFTTCVAYGFLPVTLKMTKYSHFVIIICISQSTKLSS